MIPMGGIAQQNEIGKPMPDWKKGELHIHHIYTGRAESSFLLMPDGTSLLIDCGDWDPSPEDYAWMTPLLPDSTKRAGEWIAHYVQQFNPKKKDVDYLLVSHFHDDHIGSYQKGAGITYNRNPNYQLSGITQAAEFLKFGKIVDRDFPNYNFPKDLRKDPVILNYIHFIEWKQQQGQRIEQFKLGSTEQFALKKNPKKYPDFQILNMLNNGQVWNQKLKQVDTLYRWEHQQNKGYWNENTMSNAIRLQYGPFTYYSGGDVSGPFSDHQGDQVDLEEALAKQVGRVDVAKANHHAYLDAMTPGFVQNIQAKFYVVPVWDFEHIQPHILSRMTDEKWNTRPGKVLLTHFPQALQEKYRDMPWRNAVLEDGHICIRVYNHGKNYKIYVLDSKSPKRLVKAVYEAEVSGN